MTLFEDERILFASKMADLILTTHRVRCGSDFEFTSLLLEEVCSIAVVRRAYQWLLIVAAVLGIFAAYNGYKGLHAESINAIQNHQNTAGFSVIVGLIVVGIYWATRFSVIEIASAAARINFKISAGVEDVLGIVFQIEAAKNGRYGLRTANGGKTSSAS